MILLEGGNLDGLLVLIMAIMFGPPIVFTIIGFSIRKKQPTAGKVFFILAAVYLIIGLGVCSGVFA